MRLHILQRCYHKGLRAACLLVLCACVSACAPAEASSSLFSARVLSFLESFTSRYTTTSSSSTSSSAANGNVTLQESSSGTIEVITELCYLPVLGEDSAPQGDVWLDATNASQGYVMVQYLGDHSGQVKLQITGPDALTYTYTLTAGGDFAAFPLTGGDGSYTINTYEQDSGTSYYLVNSQMISVTLTDPLLPYLYPNQFVNYDQSSSALALSIACAEQSTSELDLVSHIYTCVMDTLDYDYTLAEAISSGGLSSYIPDLDAVIEAEEGICFDYAALMVAMLRMQNIPAKLVIGYAGESYHAWINVYTVEDGWIDEVIWFDGEDWSLMDPTFADTSGSNNYVGDGQTYTEKYVY